MAFNDHIEKYKALLKAIEDNVPRDSNGEMAYPWDRRCAALRCDIEKAGVWLQASKLDGQKGGE